MEIPSIVTQIVDFLQPSLTAYEMAVYYYLFRNSILRSGEQYARASTRGMKAIVKSHSGQSSELSYGTIKKSIDSLIEKKVIARVDDTNIDGSLYKIFIPEEIDFCLDLIKSENSKELPVVNAEEELGSVPIKLLYI